MTELEKFENCKKEYNLIHDFLKFAHKQGWDLICEDTMFIGTSGYNQQINDIVLCFLNINPVNLEEEMKERFQNERS